ncbi:mntH, partial [Symbiodinium sp. KB8]
VVSLCGSWALEEAMGRNPRQGSFQEANGLLERVRSNVKNRRVFYVSFFITCMSAWALAIFTPTFTVDLTGVWTQFINGLLMPPVVFALWYLASYHLPDGHRLSPCYKWSLFTVFGICSAFCLFSIPIAIE